MIAEIVLKFDASPPDEFDRREPAPPDYSEIVNNIRSVTELMNIAYGLQAYSGASLVNFNFVGDSSE